jgi:cytochrome b561
MIQAKYTPVAVGLHWVMAALILATWSIAIVVGDMPLSPARIAGFSWHKWIGTTVFFLVIVRLIWRATHPAPKLDIAVPAWQKKAMELTHLALYILMIAIPVIGWVMSSAKGYTVNYFGLFDLPDLVDQNKNLGHQLKEVHEWLANVLMVLVGLHILAAVKHHFIDKDGLLYRMSFWQHQDGKGAKK